MSVALHCTSRSLLEMEGIGPVGWVDSAANAAPFSISRRASHIVLALVSPYPLQCTVLLLSTAEMRETIHYFSQEFQKHSVERPPKLVVNQCTAAQWVCMKSGSVPPVPLSFPCLPSRRGEEEHSSCRLFQTFRRRRLARAVQVCLSVRFLFPHNQGLSSHLNVSQNEMCIY